MNEIQPTGFSKGIKASIFLIIVLFFCAGIGGYLYYMNEVSSPAESEYRILSDEERAAIVAEEQKIPEENRITEADLNMLAEQETSIPEDQKLTEAQIQALIEQERSRP